MKDIYKRIVLFILLCIPTRILFTMLAKTLKGKQLKLLALVATIISFGFMYIYVTGIRKTGAETMNAPIWWNNLRPIHSLLYATFAILAFLDKENSHIPLAIDVVIGFSSFVTEHFGLN